MKKFLLLPAILAVGFGVLMLVNSEPPGGSGDGAAPETEGQEVVTPSGLKYIVLKAGTGRVAKAGDNVVVHYTGKLEDGTVFDDSVKRDKPETFRVGVGKLIKGWDEGIPGMRVGSKRKLIVPPGLGYGKDGSPPDIPGDARLFFVVELIDIR